MNYMYEIWYLKHMFVVTKYVRDEDNVSTKYITFIYLSDENPPAKWNECW